MSFSSPVKGEELITPVYSTHPLIVGLDEVGDGDVDVGLLALVPPLHLETVVNYFQKQISLCTEMSLQKIMKMRITKIYFESKKPYLARGLDRIVVRAHSNLLVVEPFDNKDALLRDLEVHGSAPLLLHHLLCLQRALLDAVCPEGASSGQSELSEIKYCMYMWKKKQGEICTNRCECGLRGKVIYKLYSMFLT